MSHVARVPSPELRSRSLLCPAVEKIGQGRIGPWRECPANTFKIFPPRLEAVFHNLNLRTELGRVLRVYAVNTCVANTALLLQIDYVS